MDMRERNLPAVPDDASVEPEYIFEGEVVGEPEPKPPVVVLRPVVQVFQTINVVVQHPVPRATVRHVGYVPAGIVVAWRRRQRRRSHAEVMGQMAGAQGDHANALLWAKHQAEERQRRHDRQRERAQTAIDLIRHAHWFAIAGAVFMLLIGIAVAWARHNPADVVSPFKVLAAVVSGAVSAAAVLVWILAFGGPLALFAAFYRLGRNGDLAPKWAHTAADADVDIAIDERAVTQALRQLRIPQITDYLKLDQPMAYIVPCRQEGRGTYCEVRLPNGLPASEIAKPVRRERLAAGLYRHTKEVWPSTGADNSHLKLWVADKGALEEGAGPYPLLEGGFTDVFKGLPFGRILKGDPSRIPVIGRNTMCGGMPEQGKSTAAKVVACGYTLDIVTELRIYVPDTNFDFERFAPRCSSYVMGAEDEYIEQIAGELEELKDELQSRGQLLIDYQQEEVTYELAHAGVGLHPVFVLLEEAHVAIQHKKWGKTVSGLLCDIVKLDRKRGVHLMLSTQAPTKDSMPRDVTRNCANGIAFAVGDHVANDALLGQGAYRGGHRATELIPGTDRGIALCKGFSGERSEMVQVHRIQGRQDNDQVTPIVKRALAAMAAGGRAVPGTEKGPLAITSRDLLTDLDTVLAHRSGKVRVSELPDLLHNLAPSWGEYRGLTGVQLRKRLFAAGVPTTNPGNVPTLDLDDLAAAIREREDEVS
jgi:S-DNA-T family DNA segregation ATPase FtsK/SpoIIIE